MPRYGPGARWYDVLSGERFVYRRPRERAIDLLHLRAGDRVLDVGCGTGLNFARLRDAVGPAGVVVGVDLSEPMLAVAQRRTRGEEWHNVNLVATDAAVLAGVEGPFDAVIFAYTLSIITRWEAAWTRATGLLTPGGRAAIIDLALPRGRWRFLWPAARIACWTGGVDPYRAPWRLLDGGARDVTREVLRGGHVRLAVGVPA